MHAPIMTRVNFIDSVSWASPIMRSSVVVFMKLRAAVRSVALRVGGAAEYAH